MVPFGSSYNQLLNCKFLCCSLFSIHPRYNGNFHSFGVCSDWFWYFQFELLFFSSQYNYFYLNVNWWYFHFSVVLFYFTILNVEGGGSSVSIIMSSPDSIGLETVILTGISVLTGNTFFCLFFFLLECRFSELIYTSKVWISLTALLVSSSTPR